MLLMTHWAGMRIGEVTALKIDDIHNADGGVKQEIRLDAARTKGKNVRVVLVNDNVDTCARLHSILLFNGHGSARPCRRSQDRLSRKQPGSRSMPERRLADVCGVRRDQALRLTAASLPRSLAIT